MIGRDAELRAVGRLLDEGRSATVVGPRGIGKTRLLRQVVEQLRTDPAVHVCEVVATDASRSTPLGALAVHLHGAPPGVDDLIRVQRALVDQAGGARLVLVADDAHLLDDASAVILHQLTAAGRAQVVASVRTGTVPSTAITALVESGHGRTVALPPLDPDAVADLTASLLDGEVTRELAHRVWTMSEGNPMLVTLVIQTGVESHTLERRDGVWTGTLAGDDRLMVAVEERLARLDPAEREAVEVLALTEPLEGAVVHRLIPASVLESLRRRKIVVAIDGAAEPRWRLARAIDGEGARRRLAPGRREQVVGELATALGAAGPAEAELLLRVAVWGATVACPLSPEVLVRAAGVARGRDLGSAVHLLRAAVAAGAPPTAAVELAQVLTLAGRIDEATEVLTEFEFGGRSPSERALTTALLATGLIWTVQRPAAAHSLLAEARRSIGDDPTLGAVLDATGSAAHLLQAELGPAERSGTRALSTPGLPDELAVQSAATVAVALAFRGAARRALELVEAWTPTATRLAATAPPMAAGVQAGRWTAQLILGDLEALEESAGAALTRAIGVGDPLVHVRAAQALAQSAVLRGRPAQAAALLREVLAVLGNFDRMFRAWNLVLLSEALAIGGRPTEARRALLDAEGPEPLAAIFVADRYRAEAAVLAAEGLLTDAVGVAKTGAHWAARRGLVVAALRSWHDVARFGGTPPRREVAALPAVDGPLGRACRDHIEALVLADGARLDGVAAAFASCGALLLSAEAGAAAARAHRQAGRAREAAASAHRWRVGLEAGDLPATPALRLPSPDGPPLTGREHEVALLAARGLSDLAIAGQLGISARTVATHLSRVYMKLHIDGRKELGPVFDPISGASA